MLSEEEIIKGITNIIYTCNEVIEDEKLHDQEEIESVNEQLKFTEGLLDLYKKEKEKNALLLANNNGYFDLKEYIKNNYISKDEIKERKKWYEDTCEHLSKNGIDLDKYDQYQGAIELCEELLEEK